jgi:hypothetical protein
MSPAEVFVAGVVGSLAVEVVTAAQLYDGSSHSLPDYYRKFGFYVLRLLLALVGGGLAIAYEVDKPLLAANIGAAAPLIIRTLVQGQSVAGPTAPSQQNVSRVIHTSQEQG